MSTHELDLLRFTALTREEGGGGKAAKVPRVKNLARPPQKLMFAENSARF